MITRHFRCLVVARTPQIFSITMKREKEISESPSLVACRHRRSDHTTRLYKLTLFSLHFSSIQVHLFMTSGSWHLLYTASYDDAQIVFGLGLVFLGSTTFLLKKRSQFIQAGHIWKEKRSHPHPRSSRRYVYVMSLCVLCGTGFCTPRRSLIGHVHRPLSASLGPLNSSSPIEEKTQYGSQKIRNKLLRTEVN
jgi:hypothetical protein